MGRSQLDVSAASDLECNMNSDTRLVTGISGSDSKELKYRDPTHPLTSTVSLTPIFFDYFETPHASFVLAILRFWTVTAPETSAHKNSKRLSRSW